MQERFAVLYALTGNVTQAAKEAGYSPKTAYRQGHDLLKRPHVLARANLEAERLVAQVRLEFAPLALKARLKLEAIIDNGAIKNMATLQAINTALEYAGLKPAQKSEVSGPDGQPLTLGVVAIPAKAKSIEEWVKNREERRALAERTVIDADGK
jgi:phage terminase small subunit